MSGTPALSYAIKYVGDMERAVRFYRDRVGLTLRSESPFWSEFETGSTTLALHLASAEHPAGSCDVGFRVGDVDAFHADLAAHGVEFSAPPSDLRGRRIARFLDPDGAHGHVSAG